MGYTLKIGQASVNFNEDFVRINCAPLRFDNAPAFGDPTDYTNERWPSYSAWADAMEILGLTDVMFCERNNGVGFFNRNGADRYPLIQEHPGAAPITIEHVEEVEERLAAYKAKHPDHIAQYRPLKPGAQPLVPDSDMYADDAYIDDPRYDGTLCRGEWLAWWLRWAIENCSQPVFVNS
jgi:hypothetical protein